jgi:hypothetical protein
MLLNPAHSSHFDRLADQLRLTSAPTAQLVKSIIANACIRLPALAGRNDTQRLAALIDAGAWADAALAVIELELPQWKLRRLVYEDGEWICSLSKQPEVPVDVDDTADGYHASAALAIWVAFLEARRRTTDNDGRKVALPRVHATSGFAVCCDNFS